MEEGGIVVRGGEVVIQEAQGDEVVIQEVRPVGGEVRRVGIEAGALAEKVHVGVEAVQILGVEAVLKMRNVVLPQETHLEGVLTVDKMSHN